MNILKSIFTLVFVNLLVISNVIAQAPEKMNYQAVARDLSGLPLVSTAVNLQFDILQGSSTGVVAYSETQSKTTNQFGLFTAEIGAGSVVSGSFAGITWGLNPYYLRITVNGDVVPATQLLSVPYALYSKTTGGAGAGLVPGPGIDITGGVITSISDTSATNELQMLSISNDTIFLSNGGFVLLPSGASDSDWTYGSGVIYNLSDNVGIGVLAPVDRLEVEAVTGNVSAINGVNNQTGVGSPTYGIYGVSAGDVLNSAGVKGEATGSDGTGVYGEINSNINGVGVRGYHNGIAPSASYGVVGRISSTSANSLSTGVSGINFGTGVGLSSFVSNGASNEKTSLTVSATSGVTPTPGLGSRIDFKTGNSILGTSPIASITATSTNVTLGAEAGDLSFSTIQNGNIRTKRMIIKSNGNTGIGTLTPSALLDVAGVTQTDSLRVLSGAGNVGDVLTSDAAGNATWQAPAGTGGIDADADGWPASMDLNDADNTITFYDADNDSLNELQQLILVGDSLALTNGGGSITIPDADPNNERITSFSLNGTSDSLAIIESGVRHTMPLSDLNNGAWTKGIGNDIFNNTDSVGIGTADPKSLLQLGDFMHQFPLVLSGTEEYTVSSYNTFWDGTTLRNTTGGISGLSIVGDDNGNPVMSWLLFPSQPVGTDMFSLNPSLKMNLRSRGLAINSDVAGAGLDVTSLDSASIFMDIPDDNSQPTLSYRAPGGTAEILSLRVPNTLTNSYTLTYPIGLPTTAGSALVSDLAGNLSWSAAGASPWVTNGTTIHPATLTQNVGIGSNSAAYALEIKRSQAGTSPLLGITNPTTGDASIHFSTGTGNFSIGRNGNTFKIAQASNLGSNVRMTIGSTGNVGFGITAPTAKVHAEGFGGQALQAQNSSATTATMNLINFGGGPAFTVTNGYIGLNTTNPTAFLHLNNSLRLQNLGGPAPAAGSVLTAIDVNGNAQWQTPSAASPWTLSGTNIYPSTLTNNVGIGTSTPGLIGGATNYLTIASTGAYASGSVASLELKGNTNSSNDVAAKIDFLNGLGTNNTARIENITSGTSTAEGQLLFYTKAAALAERMRIDEDGNVGIGTTTPNTSLDVANDVAIRESVNTTTTNAISNMAGTAGTSFINFTSQTSNFSIFSIADGVDGKILRLFNSTGFNMTVANDTGTSNSILTMSGGNISTVGQGVITLQYSANEQRWIVVSIVQ
ncbi:MAG: hypothetical protein P8Q14_04385 [Vicingaceae bacterium]|nr:hypothetical protein [Vicingaceae bacterium]